MEQDQGLNHPNLLGDLCCLLQDPELPALLEQLSHLDSHPAPESLVLERLTKKPSLLQQLDKSASSKSLKRSPSPSEEESPPKRRQLQLSSESSGRTLMSRLLNRNEKKPSTHTSPKSYLHQRLKTTPDNLNHLGRDPVTDRDRLDRQTPPQLQKRIETSSNQRLMTKTTSHQRNNDFSSQTCRGTLRQENPLVPITTPVAKRPVGFFEPTTETYPKLS